jgi:large subunit ribosomal protein L30
MKRVKAKKQGAQGQKLRITLVRSAVGYPRGQHETVAGLGLRKINSQVIRQDRPEVWGMIRKVSHLIKVEVVEK